MQKAHNLPYAQVLALVNAMKQLNEHRSAAHALDKSEYSENTLEKPPMFNLKHAQLTATRSLQEKGIVKGIYNYVIILSVLEFRKKYWNHMC